MFTLQSGQIENALRTVGVPDISAREMMSGMANCQATIEHRGPVALTKPTINMFPTIKPAGTNISPRFTNQVKNTLVNIPPWQNVPFTPLPFLPVPPWETIPYPQWPTTPLEEPVLRVPGPVSAGPVSTPAASVTNLTTNNITNAGDITNQGDVINKGDVYGDNVTVNNDLTVQNNFITNGSVTNNSTVINKGDTYNNSVHNQHTVNHGPTFHHSETHFDGPNHIRGPNYINGPTYIQNVTYVNGTPLQVVNLDVVTSVTWDGTLLQKTVKTLRVFGSVLSEATTTVLDCGA